MNLENLIDLPLLTYYDEKIKKWVVNKVSNVSGQTSFLKRDELPTTGEEGTLYIVEDAILTWDGTQYKELSGSPSSVDGVIWGSF